MRIKRPLDEIFDVALYGFKLGYRNQVKSWDLKQIHGFCRKSFLFKNCWRINRNIQTTNPTWDWDGM